MLILGEDSILLSAILSLLLLPEFRDGESRKRHPKQGRGCREVQDDEL